jgi:transposase-like protein
MIRCPFCSNEDMRAIEKIPVWNQDPQYLCNVCSKTFRLKDKTNDIQSKVDSGDSKVPPEKVSRPRRR